MAANWGATGGPADSATAASQKGSLPADAGGGQLEREEARGGGAGVAAATEGKRTLVGHGDSTSCTPRQSGRPWCEKRLGGEHAATCSESAPKPTDAVRTRRDSDSLPNGPQRFSSVCLRPGRGCDACNRKEWEHWDGGDDGSARSTRWTTDCRGPNGGRKPERRETNRETRQRKNRTPEACRGRLRESPHRVCCLVACLCLHPHSVLFEQAVWFAPIWIVREGSRQVGRIRLAGIV